jgi:hypothetical protein
MVIEACENATQYNNYIPYIKFHLEETWNGKWRLKDIRHSFASVLRRINKNIESYIGWNRRLQSYSSVHFLIPFRVHTDRPEAYTFLSQLSWWCILDTSFWDNEPFTSDIHDTSIFYKKRGTNCSYKTSE